MAETEERALARSHRRARLAALEPREATRRALLFITLLAILARGVFLVEFIDRDAGLEHDLARDMHRHLVGAQLVLEGDWKLVGLLERAHAFSVNTIGVERYLERYGEAPLAHAPLYSYLIAGTLTLGHSVHLLRAGQLALTLLVAWMTFLLARALTGRDGVAVLAFAFMAFHSTTVLYAGFLLRATVVTFLMLGLILTLTRYAHLPRPGRAAMVGLCLGALHLAKGLLGLAGPAVAFAMIALAWRAPSRWRDPIITVAATLAVLSPLMLRNWLCGVPLLQSSGLAELTLITGNQPGSDGLHLMLPDPAMVRDVLDRSGSALEVLLNTIATHPGPGSYLSLEIAKLAGFFNAYEPWNNVSFALHRHMLDSLALFPVSTWILLPPAIVGLAMTVRRPRIYWPIHLGLGLVLASVLLGFALARYRLPAMPYLAVAAAIGVSGLLDWSTSARRTLLAITLLVALALAVSPSTPGPTGNLHRHEAHALLGRIYANAGKLDAASREATRAVDTHPLIAAGAAPVEARGRDLAALTESMIRYHVEAANLLAAAGRVAQAEAMLSRLEAAGATIHRTPARP